MSTVEPVNTQQVLQMGSHTEKLQQTIQEQPMTLSQQLEEERVVANELKKKEIQDPENSQPIEPSNPDARGRSRRIRVHSKNLASSSKTKKEIISNSYEKEQGNQIHIIA